VNVGHGRVWMWVWCWEWRVHAKWLTLRRQPKGRAAKKQLQNRGFKRSGGFAKALVEPTSPVPEFFNAVQVVKEN
jgi:hypothetical protein